VRAVDATDAQPALASCGRVLQFDGEGGVEFKSIKDVEQFGS